MDLEQKQMEQKRLNFQSELNTQLKYNQRMIVTLKKSIENIEASSSANKDAAFYENRVKQTLASIENYRLKNEELERKLSVVMNGLCDMEILEKHARVQNDVAKKQEEAAKKESFEKVKEQKRKDLGKKYNQMERDTSRQEHYAKKDIERAYERYCQIVDSAPDYILTNIKTMPNNKGYKFKNVYFYGELPAERNAPFVIFERKPDGMLITETYSDQEIVYFKRRDGKQKELVSRTHLVKNVNAPATRIPIC